MKAFFLALTIVASVTITGCAHHTPVPAVTACSATDASTQTQPGESPVIAHHLVDLQTEIPTLRFDLRYATNNNFTHTVLYDRAKAYLHRDAANALAAVQRELIERGIGGLLIYDAYRPFHVQETLWSIMPDERYVSNPAKNRGRHTRGTTVDITLVDMHGNPLPMPTEFDHFSEKAFRDYAGATAEEKTNRTLLEDIMVKHGFEPFFYEWWHFDLKNWQAYPVLNVSFDQLARGGTTTVPVPDVIH